MDVSKMPVVERLKADLRAAMKARQSSTVATLRSMLSAVDNASAVEQDASHVPVVGRSGDVPRRELSEEQVMGLLRAEAEARRSTISKFEQLGKDDEVARLRAELEIVVLYLDDPVSG